MDSTNKMIQYLAEASELPISKIITILTLQKMYYLEYATRESSEVSHIEVPLCIDNASVARINREDLTAELEFSSEFKSLLRKAFSGEEDLVKFKFDRRFNSKGKELFRSLMDGDD